MKQNRQIFIYVLPIIVAILTVACVLGRRQGDVPYQHDQGFVFGTSYNIKYQSEENLKSGIEETLKEVDAALSPFNKESVITAVNENRDVKLNDMFLEVFDLAAMINKDTDGAFDITVAPLVNAWGFGFKSGNMPDDRSLDSLRSFVGFGKIKLEHGRIVKQDKRTMLDCSAIAKGYGVEQVAKYLRSKGIDNFMVEIGGEIVVQGNNPKQNPWTIAVTKPTDDSLSTNTEMQTALSLTDVAMATSGNYRNFYYKDGKKYAHTIDPATGKPVQHNILSATVIADNCATADAFATAFMVMGKEKAMQVLKKHKELKAYFIYADEKGNNAVWYSPELKEHIAK